MDVRHYKKYRVEDSVEARHHKQRRQRVDDSVDDRLDVRHYKNHRVDDSVDDRLDDRLDVRHYAEHEGVVVQE